LPAATWRAPGAAAAPFPAKTWQPGPGPAARDPWRVVLDLIRLAPGPWFLVRATWCALSIGAADGVPRAIC